MNRTLIAISVFDSSGATGLAADLKTFQTFRVYGAGVATAIAAQNTSGVQALYPVAMEIVGQQLEALAQDMKVHGLKIGALVTEDNVRIISTMVKALEMDAVMVVDPSFKASTGEQLLEPSALDRYRDEILPLAGVLTPNIEEAGLLSEIEVKDVSSAKEAARVLHGLGCKDVIVTSVGFDSPMAIDMWFDGKNFHLFDAPRLHTNNTLGLGTTFSSILAVLLSKGVVMGKAIDSAKKYVVKAAQHPFRIGKGAGPLNHTVPI